MTPEERQQALVAAVRDAERRYGYALTAILQSEALGAVLQVRPTLTLNEIPNWQPPETPKSIEPPIEP